MAIIRDGNRDTVPKIGPPLWNKRFTSIPPNLIVGAKAVIGRYEHILLIIISFFMRSYTYFRAEKKSPCRAIARPIFYAGSMLCC